MFEDRAVQCVDCGQEFIFTAGEQEFFDRKGFKETPKRCRPCRDLRKQRRDSGGGGNRGARGGGGSRGPREMFDAVCATCGVQTQVPFQPTPGRAVYCRDCFAEANGNR